MYARFIARSFARKCSFQRTRKSSLSSLTTIVANSPKPQLSSEHEDHIYPQKNVHRSHIHHLHNKASIFQEERIDPYMLVADELYMMANRLRSMVVTEIPKLATAAEYFFKMGVEGKMFRPMVLFLLTSSLNIQIPVVATEKMHGGISEALRIPEISQMIHVASLLHDDVIDEASTRRGIGSVNVIMGNKLAVLAGDFLLSRASVALASLKNTEVVELLSTVLEHLVTGELMQMTNTDEQHCSMKYYLKKTFYKTASLMANSCEAIALVVGLPRDVCKLAYEYGSNLGIAFQIVDDILDFTGTTTSLGKGPLSDIKQGIVTAPILYALEEHPQLQELINREFKKPGDVDLALEYLRKSDGINKAKQLAAQYARNAAVAVESFPPSESDHAKACRKALIDLTETVITRTK